MRMYLAGEHASTSGLSWAESAGLYIGIPIVVTALIWAAVLLLSKPSPQVGASILGQPQGLERWERTSPASAAVNPVTEAADASPDAYGHHSD